MIVPIGLCHTHHVYAYLKVIYLYVSLKMMYVVIFGQIYVLRKDSVVRIMHFTPPITQTFF